MKNKICKLFSVLLTLALVFSTCLCAIGTVSADEYTYSPTMAQGTIDGAAGAIMSNVTTRVYTQDLISMADTVKVSLASGYKAYYHFYDASGNWLKSSGKWIEGNQTVAQLTAMSNTAVYFKVAVGTTGNANLSPSTFPEGVLTVTLVAAPEGSEEEIEAETPVMAQGTIDGSTGKISTNVGTRIYTKDLIPVADYERILIAYGYMAYIHCYDADGNWLTSFGWKKAQTSDLEVAVSETKGKSMDTTYFRVVFSTLSSGNITPASLPEGAFQIVKKSEKNSDFTFEDVFQIGAASNGPWQEGAIFDGKLFLFNHAETGKVVDIETGEDIGTFTGDTTDFFSVHSNSMCFGTEYYSANDKYPLLYSSVYNNYEGQSNQYEGHCGVYRIIENGSKFTADLVQVIKIGFTEDLTRWKSVSGNGDVCPFGNFIVDTDKNDLYAYVMRDATKTTRYYKFDLPAVSEGSYNYTFGCKTVTLNVADIKDQFDTEYSVYLQGADYLDGMILSSSGLGHGRDGGAILRLVDLETKQVVKIYDAISAGVYNEPEVIAVDPETEKVYYGSTDGQLRWLTCIDKYREEKAAEEECTHEYDNACDAECNLCFEIREVADHVYDNACDADCNECGDVREVGDHAYDNDCDADCNVCGDTREVADHVYDNACDADCNVCSAIREVGNHLYDYACDTNCYICGELTRPEAEHVRTGPVCIEGHCVYGCGLTMPAIADHSYEAYYELPPTCGIDGAYYYQCQTCGDAYEVYPPATGEHTYDNACDTICNGCAEEREVAGHVYDNACDAECNECGDVREVADHVYDNDCDADCNECGDIREVADHVYKNYVSNGDATCTEDGTKTGKCECGDTNTITDEGSKLDHIYDVDYDDDCNVCGEVREAPEAITKVELREKDGVKYIYVNGYTSVKGLFEVDGDYYFADWGGVVICDKAVYVRKSYCDLASGKEYIFGEDGKILNGVVEKDGIKYLYINGRTTSKGIYKVGEYYYMSDWGGVLFTDGKYYTSYTYCDLPRGEYLIDEDGRFFIGVVEKDGVKYLYVNGYTTGKGIYKIGDDYYMSDWGGVLFTDGKYSTALTHCDLPGGQYLIGEDGRLFTGVVEKDGVKYLYVNGYTTGKGIYKVGNDYYMSDWGGVLFVDGKYSTALTHCDLPGGQYLIGEDGKFFNGVVEKDGVKYLYVNGYTTGKGIYKIGDDYYMSDWGGLLFTDGKYSTGYTYCDLPGGTYLISVDGRIILPD